MSHLSFPVPLAWQGGWGGEKYWWELLVQATQLNVGTNQPNKKGEEMEMEVNSSKEVTKRRNQGEATMRSVPFCQKRGCVESGPRLESWLCYFIDSSVILDMPLKFSVPQSPHLNELRTGLHVPMSQAG